MVRAAWDAGRLPHALLLGGAEGIGKATLAYAHRPLRAVRRRRAGAFARRRSEPSGGAAGGGAVASRPSGAAARAERQRQAALDDPGRAGAQGALLLRLDGGARRLAGLHRRHARRDECAGRQRAAEDAGGAAEPLAVPAGQPRAGPALADHPLALPHGAAARADRRGGRRRAGGPLRRPAGPRPLPFRRGGGEPPAAACARR